MKLKMIAEIQYKNPTTNYRRTSASGARQAPALQDSYDDTKEGDSEENRPDDHSD